MGRCFVCDYQAVELDSGKFAARTFLGWKEGASEAERLVEHDGVFDTAEEAEAYAQARTRELAAACKL